MPIHVPPISRRAFLGQTAAAAGCLALRTGWAAEDAERDPNTFALLADTHIPSEPSITARDVNMTANLRQVVETLIARRPQLAGAIINGDCAYLKGLPGDYQNLAGVVKPLSEAGLPLHLTMGNHDARQPLYEALADQQPTAPPVESKHVTLLKSPKANWLLLDSLLRTDVVTGELGLSQLDWLAKTLADHSDKPAIVVAHHNPQFEPGANGAWSGLKDSRALFDVLTACKQVKAYIYGHTHAWGLNKVGDVHLVNLPPVAYVFEATKPNGWVEATLQDDGMQLRLHCLNLNHPQHEEIVKLSWR